MTKPAPYLIVKPTRDDVETHYYWSDDHGRYLAVPVVHELPGGQRIESMIDAVVRRSKPE